MATEMKVPTEAALDLAIATKLPGFRSLVQATIITDKQETSRGWMTAVDPWLLLEWLLKRSQGSGVHIDQDFLGRFWVWVDVASGNWKTHAPTLAWAVKRAVVAVLEAKA